MGAALLSLLLSRSCTAGFAHLILVSPVRVPARTPVVVLERESRTETPIYEGASLVARGATARANPQIHGRTWTRSDSRGADYAFLRLFRYECAVRFALS
jgi:hypothetical protein